LPIQSLRKILREKSAQDDSSRIVLNYLLNLLSAEPLIC
jgi:hypothetical protein